jgi:hypothetical protein
VDNRAKNLENTGFLALLSTVKMTKGKMPVIGAKVMHLL